MAASILVRTYKGSQQEASRMFTRDAERLARDGWEVASQSYAPGSWGCGAFLVALVLCFVLVGILVFIYMLIVKPAGTLTVTYRRAPSPYPPGVYPCPKCGAATWSPMPTCGSCGAPLTWQTS